MLVATHNTILKRSYLTATLTITDVTDGAKVDTVTAYSHTHRSLNEALAARGYKRMSTWAADEASDLEFALVQTADEEVLTATF